MTQFLNARILVALAMIVFVGAVTASATGAFFSDTETSTGNTFAAGDIDLQIDNESYITATSTEGAGPSNLIFWPATSWAMNNLTNQLFFDFSDVKPGDLGEDTISVHVGSNDAWACMALDTTTTPENTVNEAETEAGDVTPGVNEGELQNYLHFTFWEDDGDNVFEVGETPIPSLDNVLASALVGQWHVLADSGNGPALIGGATNYVAKAWCFGTLAAAPVAQDAIGHTGNGVGDSTNGPLVRGTGFTCDGSGSNNVAQTDGITMDVAFQAIQSRNNAQFSCTSLPPLNAPTTATLTLLKSVVQDATEPVADTAWTLTASGPTPLSGVEGNASVTAAVVNPGAYTLGENSGPAGFTASDYSCVVNAGAPVVSNNLNLVAGDVAVCTVTNSENTLAF
jgi:predicted ribosomally synthesized peptide with SipW-like signal peptide